MDHEEKDRKVDGIPQGGELEQQPVGNCSVFPSRPVGHHPRHSSHGHNHKCDQRGHLRAERAAPGQRSDGAAQGLTGAWLTTFKGHSGPRPPVK